MPNKKKPQSVLCSNLFLSLVALLLSTNVAAAEPAKINSNFFYMINGKLTPGWGLQLGDPENWSIPVTDLTGKSETGKIKIEPSTYKEKGDAIKLTWAPNKPAKGTVQISGAPLNLSSVANSGALVIDMKVTDMPDQAVTIGMDCTYPCRGELEINKLIRSLKKNQWLSLPIPLSCLVEKGLDLQKMNGPFLMGTEGRLGIEITNIRLEKIADSENSCLKK